MKKLVFEGSAVAIVTPFHQEGVDYKKLEALIHFQLASKTDAIVVCGSTGESSTMPDKEHLEVIDFAIRTVAGRVPVIAGIASNDTAHAVELCQKASKLNPDALLCVTPYYNKTSQEGLYRHFKMIAQHTDLPIILYNVPSRTNLNINPSTLKRLSQISNIVGIKECNILQVPEVKYLCGDDLVIYSGEDGLVIPLLSLGGRGVISVAANLVPSPISQMVHYHLKGEQDKALQIQLEYLPLMSAMFLDVNPIPVKEAMNILGWEVGACRMPLCEMNDTDKQKLATVLSNYDIPTYQQIKGVR